MYYKLCDLLSDLVQNALEADATLVKVELQESDYQLKVQIIDNGKGMSQETLQKVTGSFYTNGEKHPNRKFGLGIAFLIQTTADTGGSWNIESTEQKGTTVTATFDLTHIDTPPLGEVPQFIRQIITFPCNTEIVIHRVKKTKTEQNEYTLIRSELTEILGNLEDAKILKLLGDYLHSQEYPQEE
ncbi:MAG: sensor histidine kinase [Spirochaetaceae bacterium]|nr:sensor histidine kinase [Spirochaetaceae bacterium]